jgi:hypothetical protein
VSHIQFIKQYAVCLILCILSGWYDRSPAVDEGVRRTNVVTR